MPIRKEWVPAVVLLLGLWGSMLLGNLADAAPAFALKAFWKLLGVGVNLGLGVWAWLLFRRRRQPVMGVVSTALFGFASLFGLLSLWYTWKAEQISRVLGQ